MKILIAVDDTDASWDAVSFARSLLRGTDHETIVLNVADDPPMHALYTVNGLGTGYTHPHPITTDAVARRERIDEAKRLVTEFGTAIGSDQTIVELGRPVDAIERVADEHEVDLIVVGSHDKSWFERWLDGSVSRRLVHDARCPVLVVT